MGHLSRDTSRTTENLLDTAVVHVKDANRSLGAQEDDDGIMDVAVSFDGSWHKRGHVSKYGLGAVIDVATGLVCIKNYDT